MIKAHLYNRAHGARPVVIGKNAQDSAPLLSAFGELRPSRALPVFAEWLARHKPALDRRDTKWSISSRHISSPISPMP